jgi:transcription elongation factor Elf1
MREYEYVACPCCGETMQLARTAFHAELSLETFECKPCGLAVTAEAVSRTHVLIEERYCEHPG